MLLPAAVVVLPPQAAELAHALSRLDADCRREGRWLSPEIAGLLEELRKLAVAHQSNLDKKAKSEAKTSHSLRFERNSLRFETNGAEVVTIATMTTVQAAEFLRCSARNVQDLARRGSLRPCGKAGRSLLFPVAEVAAFQSRKARL